MSLRARLLLAVGAVALVALAAADVATYSALRSFLYHRVDQTLKSVEQNLSAPRFGRPDLRDLGADPRTSAIYVELRNADGSTIARVPVYRGRHLVQPKIPDSVSDFSIDDTGDSVKLMMVGSTPPGVTFRVRVVQLADGGQLVLAAPLDDVAGTLGRLVAIEVAVTGAALAAAALLGWWLVRVGLRPLAGVEETAGAIAQGDLDRRVPGADDKTEVGQVASALNVMLERIQAAFAERDATVAELRRSEERMRRFVADASHELRTPLAAVAAYAELFGRGASERPEDLARVMTGITAETGRMRELVEDLLLLARLDDGRPIDRQPVELVRVAGEAIEAARAVGPGWPVRLEASQPVEVLGDASRLRQVLDNLLSNVRAHAPAGTATEVRLRVDGPWAVVEVVDHGPGVSDEDAARLFERFFRVEASRSRTKGGAGLGLAIVAGIVGAHGGGVRYQPTPGGGATFQIHLPLAPGPDAPAPPPGAPAEQSDQPPVEADNPYADLARASGGASQGWPDAPAASPDPPPVPSPAGWEPWGS